MVIGRDVSGPNESVTVVRPADLDPAQVDMRCPADRRVVANAVVRGYGVHARRYPWLRTHASASSTEPTTLTPAGSGGRHGS